ncbi:hypothetical protein JCM11641_004520 [Rhodosporidiobolus odoratus]
MAQQTQFIPVRASSSAWEGDSTLHSYCYDYMRKRGWTESAARFAKDAGIDEVGWSGPPIEAPQGLLYEWWSVFWDVFIARSQKAGQRNPNADVYVDAMRAKRDPLVVQFAGPNPPPTMTLPRSLAHPPRGQPAAPGGPPRAQYSQMHVLEQQELQNQMQRGRAEQAPMPMQRGGQQLPPGTYTSSPVSAGPPQPHGGLPPPPPPPHSQASLPPQHAANQPPMPSYPPQNPHQAPPAHGMPHMVPASHPYATGRPPGQPHPMSSPAAAGSMSQAMSAAMAAVGLGGRDPQSLSQEEHAAVASQMRSMGALPPTPQQGQLRGQPPVRVMQQRPMADQQMRPQGVYPGMPPQGQPLMHDPNRPGMQQGPPQQRMMLGQYGAGPGQPASAASPAYSAAPSPYATPHIAHMQVPPPGSQSSPSQFNAPLPPPSRQGNPRTRLPSAGGLPPQASPVQVGGMAAPQNPNAKRVGASMEEASPRSRKRVRGATRDEELNGNGEMGGAGSPGGVAGMPPGMPGFGPNGIPSRPSPSPSLMHPPQHQMHAGGPSPHSGMGGGDPGMNGNGVHGHPGMNGGGPPGHPGMNGQPSRPASAASNHFLGASPAPLPQNGMPPTPGQQPSPGHLSGLPIPPPGPGAHGEPNASMGNNTSRPFAGAPIPSSASTTPLPAPSQPLPPTSAAPPSQAQGIPVGGGGGDDSFQLNMGGGDDLFPIDFEKFLNGDMFEDGTS